MNRIVRDSLEADLVPDFASLKMEAYVEAMDRDVGELNMALTRLRGLEAVKDKIIAGGGLNQTIAMECYQFLPAMISNQRPLGSYTKEISMTNYEVSMEAIQGAQKTVGERIKEIIKRMIAFAVDIFNRIKNYITKFFTAGEDNKRELDKTQKLLTMAKRKQSGETVATEGYSTGTIPIQAPHFLHIEYTKIVAETAKLDALAQSYIKDSIALLTLQFRHCKHIIEAYHKLMKSQTPSLEEFDATAQRVVADGEQRLQQMHSHLKAFNCIEIVEEIRNNEHAGVLKYRVSIKPPGKSDMQQEQIRVTTNLMKAQDLQDHLVKLNESIVAYAAEIRQFFVQNSKVFLETLNGLNNSATTSPDGKFSAHSDYVMQVHSFLVHGNLTQVVLGLNVLNTVWRSVHQLNTRVVNEFLSS